MIFYIMSSFIFLVGGIFMNTNLKCYTEFFNFGICFICTCIDVFTKRGGYQAKNLDNKENLESLITNLNQNISHSYM